MFRHVFRNGSARCIVLAAGAVHSFTARRGERIVCRGGCVLLSQFDVTDDFTLCRNTSITVQTHGLVVIEAVEASVLEVDSVAQEYLQQLVQITLAAQRRAHVLGRHLQQIFTLRRQ